MVSGIPLIWALEPECRILVFTWSFGPYSNLAAQKGSCNKYLGAIDRDRDIGIDIQEVVDPPKRALEPRP